jgi:hypothetical protein
MLLKCDYYRLYSLLVLFVSIHTSYTYKVLFISVGGAGHVTPMLELAKGMMSHDITFLTNRLAQAYVNLDILSSSTFRIIYANDSSDAFNAEKQIEKRIISFVANRSIIDAAPDIISNMSELLISILNRTIDVLMLEKFDVIIAGGSIIGVSHLCERANIPCVMHIPAFLPNIFDFNMLNTFSFLSTDQLTHVSYRLYHTVFNLRLIGKLVPKLVPAFYQLFQTLPEIPGPFHDTFTLKNLFFSKSNPLSLISMPPSFVPLSYPHPYRKYLGGFINDIVDKHDENDLTRWIQSRTSNSLVYGAFGSSSLISYDRMFNLIHGLIMFLHETNDSCLLLAFRTVNYDTYMNVVKNIDSKHYGHILNDQQRLRIENGFVPQKWILRQASIRVFISHCGMGSALESIYFKRPILCMPFNMEQFANAILIRNLHIGTSLFVPPSLWQSLKTPYDFVHYTFSTQLVTTNMLALWTNATYTHEATLISLEMKHAGGIQRAVKEIEYFVRLGGNLDRSIPFQNTLPFYQRYMLDLLSVFIVLPGFAMIYLVKICCKRKQKIKVD